MNNMNDKSSFDQGEINKEIGQLRDEQIQAQKKVFTRWVNKTLSIWKKATVKDLFEDVKDGIVLLDLLEALTGQKLPRNRLPGNLSNEIAWTNNIAEAFKCLAQNGVPLVNIHASNIVDGEPKIILGLLWQLILHFQILQVLPPEDEADARCSHSDERQKLLNWVTSKLNREGDPAVRDFGNSWRDGHAFLALTRNLLCERLGDGEPREAAREAQEALGYPEARARLDVAFRLAEAHLGVARLLEVEDVDVEQPDQRSVMMYVSHFVASRQPQQQTVPEDQQQQQQQNHLLQSAQAPAAKDKEGRVEAEIPGLWLVLAVAMVFLSFLFTSAYFRSQGKESL